MDSMESARLRKRRAFAGAALASCLLLAGCGGSDDTGDGAASGAEPSPEDSPYDLSELEAKLVAVQKDKSPNLAVGEATCPDDVMEIKKGTTIDCTVDIEGVEAPYEVSLTREDPGGGSGNFHIKPAKPIIDVSLVVDFVRGRLNKRSAGADVSCGDEAVLVAEIGGTFDCTVSDATDSETVTMVVKNLQGDVSFQ